MSIFKENENGFIIVKEDGSSIKNCEWGDISDEKRVKYQEGFKTVYICSIPIIKIKIKEGELETEIEVPEGYEVYQAMRGQATILGENNEKKFLGRVAGLVKDGEVVEERFINIPENVIQGWQK